MAYIDPLFSLIILFYTPSTTLTHTHVSYTYLYNLYSRLYEPLAPRQVSDFSSDFVFVYVGVGVSERDWLEIVSVSRFEFRMHCATNDAYKIAFNF